MIDHADSSIHTWIPGASGSGSRDVTHLSAARRSCVSGLLLALLSAHDSRIIRPSNPCTYAFNDTPLLLYRFSTEH